MIFNIPKRGHYILTKPFAVDLSNTLSGRIEHEKQLRINNSWRYANSPLFDEVQYRISFFRQYLEPVITKDHFKQVGDFAVELPVGLVFNLKRLQVSTQKHIINVYVNTKYNKINEPYLVEQLISMVSNLQMEVEYINDPADLKIIAKDKVIWMKQKGF